MTDVSDGNTWTPGDVVGIMTNPFYAIEIDPALAVDHEPLFSEDEWVKVNVKLIRDLGAENYLRNLLAILKGNWVAGPEIPDDPIQSADAIAREADIELIRHADIDADYADGFVVDAIRERLASDPTLLARSAAAALA